MDNITTCTFDGCDRPSRARGWCHAHYKRWKRNGDPAGVRAMSCATPEQAFSERTTWDGGCLAWTGTTDRYGYGVMRSGGKLVRAHRYAWERANGAIPAGLLVDHMCYRRECANVAHMRLVTNMQNIQNRSGAERGHDLPRGVYRARGRGRFLARVSHMGKGYSLGTYSTPEEASAVAAAKRAELFGEFAGRG